jgi:cyclic pyranopterin phosphate synthase
MIDIYTDGSCLKNPGPGGWAAVIGVGESRQRLSGDDLDTTNNKMEMMAVIKGLEALSPGSTVTVHSDSQYVIKTMLGEYKRGKNHDLWEHLDRQAQRHRVSWKWVKAHAGDPLNEEADRLAKAAMTGAARRLSARGDGEVKPKLSHIDAQGSARMVNVGAKPETRRTAVAQGTIVMNPETLALALAGRMEKGDVFTVARLAGINAAKRTDELIPLAHSLPLDQVAVDFESAAAQGLVTITATVETTAKTGVEMEALTAVAVSALAIYDMCKAADRSIVLRDVHLLSKRGGQRGDYTAN